MAAKKAKPIYLGKKGRIFGPFTEEEIDFFQSSGKIEEYNWIWETKAQKWLPLDEPPAPVTTLQSMPVAQGRSPTESPRNIQPRVAKRMTRTIEVVCHDFKCVIAGSMNQMSDVGCEFFTDDAASVPRFASRSKVHLNLLDAKTGRTINVHARLLDARRTENGWNYRMHWKENPNF